MWVLQGNSHLWAYDDDSLQNQLLAFLFICLMKPGAFNATIFIRTLAQATGEVDGKESWMVFTPKRASSKLFLPTYSTISCMLKEGGFLLCCVANDSLWQIKNV